MEYWLIYAVLGAFVGFIAGLLGIGGGAVIVPVLLIIFGLQDVPHEHEMHVALATSLACIVFSSLMSLRQHNARGAVDWKIFRALTPGIVAGTILGTFIATLLATDPLKVIFGVFLLYVAIQLIIDSKPKPHRQLPPPSGLAAAGGAIGVVSALVGIGGAAVSIPFMIWCNVSMRNAIGTASAIGFPIAVTGTVSYAISGWNATNLPAPHLGYIYLPALAGITIVSLFFVPIGVRMSHRLPVATLKKVWAIFLLILAGQIFYSTLK